MLFGGLSQDVKDTFIKPKALASGNARFDGAGRLWHHRAAARRTVSQEEE
jgi:hypothetical protein